MHAHDSAPLPVELMPDGACTCEACRKLAALAADHMTWEDYLRHWPGESQRWRRGA